MRTLTLPAVNSMMAEDTSEVWLTLLTMNHVDLPEPIRVVNNLVNMTSRGNEYVAFPFEFNLPLDDAESLPSVQIKIDNIELLVMETIRGLSSPPNVVIEVVLASSPDLVEMAIYDMTMREANYDAQEITADLVIEDVLNQRWPANTYNPAQFAGLFE